MGHDPALGTGTPTTSRDLSFEMLFDQSTMWSLLVTQIGLGDMSEAAKDEAKNTDTEGGSPPPPKQEVVHRLGISTSLLSPIPHLYGTPPSALMSPILLE